jgi:hypothetical protein
MRLTIMESDFQQAKARHKSCLAFVMSDSTLWRLMCGLPLRST